MSSFSRPSGASARIHDQTDRSLPGGRRRTPDIPRTRLAQSRQIARRLDLNLTRQPKTFRRWADGVAGDVCLKNSSVVRQHDDRQSFGKHDSGTDKRGP